MAKSKKAEATSEENIVFDKCQAGMQKLLSLQNHLQLI